MDQRPTTGRLARAMAKAGHDPRQLQLAFLVPLVTFLVLVVCFIPGSLTEPTMLGGAALVFAATLAAFAVPWSRLTPLAMILVPLTDLAAIGLLRLDPDVGAVGILVVFPALWVGLAHRWSGVVAMTLASIVALTVPSFLKFGTGMEGWSRGLLLPMVTFATATSMSLTAKLWAEQRAALEEQGQRLALALEKLTAQQRLRETIVETVDVGLLAIGPDGEYESMNPHHQQFMQIAFPDGHDGFAGHSGHAYAADKVTALEHHQMPTVRARQGDAFSGYTIWIGAELDQRRALSVSARPMYDDSGNFRGAVLAYKDVTDLMHALRVKDEFVASVSHELRTPLTSIIGYVDLARDPDARISDEVRHYLDVAGRNAERLLLLVSDLLTSTLGDEGAVNLSTEPVDLTELARVSLLEAQPRAAAAGVRLLGNLRELPELSADPGRLAQVMDNLLSNAIKYTLEGGSVRLRLEHREGEVVVSVADDGIGMSSADQDKLFTKFFRADTARAAAIPGIGLGLVITKAIVEAHGGTIDVASEQGLGTTMRVRLPCVAAAVARPPGRQLTRVKAPHG